MTLRRSQNNERVREVFDDLLFAESSLAHDEFSSSVSLRETLVITAPLFGRRSVHSFIKLIIKKTAPIIPEISVKSTPDRVI